MKRKITFTASYIWDVDDEWIDENETFDTFKDIEEFDYDNVGRPLEHLKELDWTIESVKIEKLD